MNLKTKALSLQHTKHNTMEITKQDFLKALNNENAENIANDTFFQLGFLNFNGDVLDYFKHHTGASYYCSKIFKSNSQTGLNILSKLSKMELFGDDLKDISAISRFKNLCELKILKKNFLCDLTPLKHLSSIEYLTLGDCNVQNIDFLKDFVNLKRLNLYCNEISDISAFENLTNLKELYLSCNKIENISVISNMTNLEILALDYNKITDISAISKMKNLKKLVLSYNPITDLSPLYELQNIKELHLHGTNISLQELEKMQQIFPFSNGFRVNH